jgi:hypothetical protein
MKKIHQQILIVPQTATDFVYVGVAMWTKRPTKNTEFQVYTSTGARSCTVARPCTNIGEMYNWGRRADNPGEERWVYGEARVRGDAKNGLISNKVTSICERREASSAALQGQRGGRARFIPRNENRRAAGTFMKF